MAEVLILRRVLFWAGWIVLALGVVAAISSLLATPSQFPMMSQPAIMTVVMSMLYGVVFSLLLFAAWGMLTVLCEIHDRLEEQLDLMTIEEPESA